MIATALSFGWANSVGVWQLLRSTRCQRRVSPSGAASAAAVGEALQLCGTDPRHSEGWRCPTAERDPGGAKQSKREFQAMA